MHTFTPIVLLAAACIPSVAGATEIPVVNPSFESPAYATCSWAAAAGWVNAGAWNPGFGNTCAPLNGFPNGVPDGLQTGWVNSPNLPIKQTLPATVEPNALYTLSVAVGRRSDGFPMGSYKIQLTAGDLVLAEDLNSLSPAPGSFVTSTISALVPPGDPAIGLPLTIKLFVVTGPQADFDDVHLFVEGGGAVQGDLNGDDHVDGADLGLLLGAWGTCASCANCPADLNHDCVVDGADLGLMLGSWG
ncbi:MAG: hypothetical protein U0575_13830 [Phycisphaerales bacterium]